MVPAGGAGGLVVLVEEVEVDDVELVELVEVDDVEELEVVTAAVIWVEVNEASGFLPVHEMLKPAAVSW